ncbi:hypothetical protein HYDPIDRAFT_177724 [Hydnomerulius pinastri MD-312]|uniref:ubiquitinyl hydrolase 1 n=1 Tax=Hydnomerulius pinastri MD-312 TaxID=994086 RepID=A0A0C9V336_9AGAM|nr:hypothetical protein HYDPIDRAFT_177724 [Hydnomerulius pinastri MD-312]
MAASQPPYPHPGPSNYYQHHPPPPHFAYGSHSPAPPPGPGPYQYQYPLPPMNGHGHPIHAPSSPRISSQGRGYPPSRGGPSYQNFHHHAPPPHHYSYPQHSPHSPGPYPPAPPPQHPHHSKYPHPHAQPVPYSPNYAIHPSSPYASAWQPQQPLSPLPKQLSMLPPVSPGPLPSQPSQPEESIPPLPMDSASRPENEQSTYNDNTHEVSENSETPQSPPRTHIGSISTVSSASSPTSPSVSSPKTLTNRSPEYVIWSKRPSNPLVAPGIIISPRARPPDDIVQKALNLPSPPPSPEPTEDAARDQAPTPTPPDHVDVPSSAATETTPATSSAPNTSVPASPVSTNTSLSATGSSSRSKSVEPPQPERVTTPQAEEKALPVEQPSEPATTSETTAAATTPSIPAPKPAGPKPSWASLLRSDGATPSKPNALPTSSLVGFSIPASALSSASAAPAISPSKKPELLSLLTSGPSGQPSMKIRPRGLVNTGNMCFANAVLQVLMYCPPFWRLFHELGKFVDSPADGDVSNSKTPLVDATVRFLREFIPKEKPAPEGKGKGVDRAYKYGDEEEDVMDSFIPTYVYDALKEKKRFDHMRGGQQEDAEEFLGFYLDTLEEELLSISSSLSPKAENGHANSEAQNGNAIQEDGLWLEVGKRNRTAVTRTTRSTESPITRMFGGKFRSTLRVPHQRDSVMFEDWRSLRLDIQREQIHTIKDALAYISSPQSVQVTSVTRPGATLDATQLVQIDSLPPILILHLKRFLYDASAGGVAKVGKQVSFTPELEVGSDLLAPGKKIHSTRYKLFGGKYSQRPVMSVHSHCFLVLYHHGQSASGGHYTLDVLHPNIDMSPTKPREAWIRIDDELVSDVRPEDVFGTPERDDRCAYLLFYRRISGAART